MKSRYTALLGELERLRGRFALEAVANCGLLAQRYWDAHEMTDGGWEAFVRRAARPDCWEEWHLLAGGEGLIRFYGSGNALDAFTRLAESGWLSLARLRNSSERGRVALGNDPYLCGWMMAVFETALATMTPSLRLEYERWGLTDEEAEAVDEFDPAYWCGAGDDRHPAHPYLQTLACDLFTSSAEAIACWLDPEEIATVDFRLEDDLPIRLQGEDASIFTAVSQPEKSAVASTDELSTADAAHYVGVGEDTLLAYVRAGQLARRNISPPGSGKPRYRYRIADLDRFLREGYRLLVPPTSPAPRSRTNHPPSEFRSKHLDLD